jgi:hypothetical protein
MVCLARISHQAAWNTGKALGFWSEARMIKNTVCYSSMPTTVQAGLDLHEIVGCAVRTVNLQCAGLFRCARRTLRSLRPSYCYAFRSSVALSNTSPYVSPGGEMFTPRFGFIEDFAKKRNNLVYFRLSKMLCGFKDQVRARPSGETYGLSPGPAPVILVRNAG